MTSTRATKQALIKQLSRYKDSTGCTYQDIADEIGSTHGAVYNWLTGGYLPTESNVDSIKIFLASKNMLTPTARMSDKTALKLVTDLLNYKKQHNLSNDDLAQQLNMHPNNISEWQKGTAKPTALNAYRIMKLLDGQTEQPTLFTMDKAFSDIFQTSDNHGNLLNLIEVDGVPYTTSRMLAEKFNKQHRNVLRDMDEIKEGLLRFEQTPEKPYFIESSYIHEQNKQEYREILINKKGCILYLFNIQGYQEEKMLFIESFEKMERALNETPTQQPTPEPTLTPQIDESPELAYIRSKLTEIMAESDLQAIYKDLNQLQTFVTMVKPRQATPKEELPPSNLGVRK
ncbi:TPA: Rha family transcriptional regulator [Streptococcus suis]|nr:Rha family transcriptional regulator [Streptococcus suis]